MAPKALARGLAEDQITTLPVRAYNVGKAQKVEGLRFDPAIRPMPAKADQAGFGLIERQSVVRQASLQPGLERVRVGLVFEGQQVLGEAGVASKAQGPVLQPTALQVAIKCLAYMGGQLLADLG